MNLGNVDTDDCAANGSDSCINVVLGIEKISRNAIDGDTVPVAVSSDVIKEDFFIWAEEDDKILSTMQAAEDESVASSKTHVNTAPPQKGIRTLLFLSSFATFYIRTTYCRSSVRSVQGFCDTDILSYQFDSHPRHPILPLPCNFFLELLKFVGTSF